ncbi:hypothetical protein TYRP_009712 [Tyrophagus putrescentiae]|nr:hypothetical protein TYRP_009712 [Tyrophagus putrescentiae]
MLYRITLVLHLELLKTTDKAAHRLFAQSFAVQMVVQVKKRRQMIFFHHEQCLLGIGEEKLTNGLSFSQFSHQFMHYFEVVFAFDVLVI